MRETDAVLLISDISGYTAFATDEAIAPRHREEIISELLEAMVDEAVYPLTVNKLEGDALLAYAEYIDDNAAHVAESVLAQVHSLHQAFADRRDAVRLERRHCACAACAAIDGLGIKSFLHAGPIAIKQIRQFREIAGAPVIVLHRLLKNSIVEREYLLLTNSFAALLPEAIAAARAHLAVADGFGEVHCTLLTSAPP